MELNIIKESLTLLEARNLKKIHLRDGDFEISLEKESHEKHIQNYTKHEEKQEYKKEEKQLDVNSDNKEYVKSPMVGTYYSSSSPDQAPFVKVGDSVSENTVICIIEAMKVMNEIKAGKKGVIKEILIENAQPVEFGTKLFVIE